MSTNETTDNSVSLSLTEGLVQRRFAPKQTADAIHILGKKRYLPARAAIESYLDDQGYYIREQALSTLINYFRLQDHWSTARRMMIDDPDSSVRSTAAGLLGTLMASTNDARTLAVLAQVVGDEEQDDLLRGIAYLSMLMVRHFDIRVHAAIVFHDMNIGAIPNVDWQWVHESISTAEANAMNKEIVQRLQTEELAPDALGHLLMQVAIGRYPPAEPVFVAHLSDATSAVRIAVLLGLLRYLHADRYRVVAERFAVSDPDPLCCRMGALLLGELLTDTVDAAALAFLGRIVQNEQEIHAVRNAAYLAMVRIKQYDRNQWQQLAEWMEGLDELDFVDWQWVAQCCEAESEG